MSAPNTDLEKQEKNHKGPLGGMAIGLAFAGLLLIGLIVWTFARGADPESGAQIEGTTGAVDEAEVEIEPGSAGATEAVGGVIDGADETLVPDQGATETLADEPIIVE